jgi:hypothetical protein
MNTRPACRSLRAAGITALVVAGADLAALPQLPAPDRRPVGLLLLTASALCVAVIVRQARRMRRQATGIRPAPELTTTGQAVGGPCDGELLVVPTGRPPPAEIWLRHPERSDGDPVHRYLLEQPSGPAVRYRYAPPD